MSRSTAAGQTWIGVAITLFATALAGASLLVISQDQFPEFYKLSAYPLYLLTFGWAIWAWLRDTSLSSWAAGFKEKRWALAVAILLALHIASSVPSGFHVLGDEGTLLSTAKSLYFERIPVAIHQSFWIDGVYTNEVSVIGKRPVGFPFFVSLFHDLFGYRYDNGFTANLVLAFLTVLAFYRLCRNFYSPTVALAGMIALASFPIFKLSARSGGFEIANLLLILISVCDLAAFSAKPSAHKLTRSLLTLVLLAQIRYESILYLALVAPFYLAIMGRRSFEFFSARNAWLPFLLLPAAWQRIALFDHETLQVPENAALFSLHHLAKHLPANLRFFASWDLDYPVVAIIFFLAPVGILLWLWNRGRNPDERKSAHPQIARLIGAYFLFQLLFHSAYYFGNFRVPVATRLSMVLIPWLVLPVLYLFSGVTERLPAFRGRFAIPLALALAIYGAHHPLAARGVLHREMTVPREVNFASEWIVEQRDFERALVITEHPEVFSVFVHSVMPLSRFIARPKPLERWLSEKTFSDVFIIQRYEISTGNPIAEHRLPQQFTYKTVSSRRLSPKLGTRILRVRSGPSALKPEGEQ